LRLTEYEKLKSHFDQERTSVSCEKPMLPASRLTSCAVREQNHIITHMVN